MVPPATSGSSEDRGRSIAVRLRPFAHALCAWAYFGVDPSLNRTNALPPWGVSIPVLCSKISRIWSELGAGFIANSNSSLPVPKARLRTHMFLAYSTDHLPDGAISVGAGGGPFADNGQAAMATTIIVKILRITSPLAPNCTGADH